MTTSTSSTTERPPLRRHVEDRMLAGVAAGVAETFDLDPTTVRIAIVALALLGGAAIPLYLAAWLLIPEEGSQRSIADDVLNQVGLR